MRLLVPLVLAGLVLAAATAAGAGVPRTGDADDSDELETSSVRVEHANGGHALLDPSTLAVAGFALLLGVLFAIRARPRP